MNFQNLKKIFTRQDTVHYDTQAMEGIVANNRMQLGKIPTWLHDEAFRKSYFKYGVPEYINHLLDLPIGNEVSYSDLVIYFSQKLHKVDYLELGVSVGKNFLLMAEGFTNASLTGFDIENIHPVLSEKFTYLGEENWDAKPDSLRKEDSTLTRYTFNSNEIKYVAGDIWDENNWAKLKGSKFNIIFSDALHTPEALLWEYQMIQKYDLLDDQFIFLWDDLNHGLEKSFYIISDSLKKKYKLTNEQVKLIKVNGWLGNNEKKHDVGIIMNLPS